MPILIKIFNIFGPDQTLVYEASWLFLFMTELFQCANCPPKLETLEEFCTRLAFSLNLHFLILFGDNVYEKIKRVELELNKVPKKGSWSPGARTFWLWSPEPHHFTT